MARTDPESILTHDATEVAFRPMFIYPDLRPIVKIFLVFLFFTIVFGIFTGVFLAFLSDQNIKSPLIKAFLNLIAYLAILILTIKYAIKKGKTGPGSSFSIDWGKIQVWLVPVLVINALALIVGLEKLSSLVPMPISVQKFFQMTFKKDIFSIITVVVAAPILEEILCRGIILRGLLERYSSFKAILISAIFFAVIHMNPWQALPAFASGLFIGWVYYKTKSIIPGIIIHATINATASAFLFLPEHRQDILGLLGMPHYLMLCAIAIMLFSAGCITIYKKTSPNSIH